MFRVKNSLFLSLFCLIVLAGCNSGPEPVAITELTKYQNEVLKFSVQYPKNWVSAQQADRFIVFSSNDARSRFNNYASIGFPGAMIDVFATKIDSTKTEDDLIAKAKRFEVDYKQSSITIDGVQGKRLDYGFPLEDGDFKGVFVIASKDQISYTTLKIEAFADSWEKYSNDFEKIISSITLAETQQKRQDTMTVIEEAPFPSEKLIVMRGNGFSISIPDNFYAGKASSTNTLSSYNYIGDRRGDCNIQVDVLDGSKTKDKKKAITDLAAKYPGASSPNAIKIDGVDGYIINYKPTKDVRSRVLFAAKGDRIYRITVNWFVPEANNYLSIFEKSINSIKIE